MRSSRKSGDDIRPGLCVVETKLDKHMPRHSDISADPSGRPAGASVPVENLRQRRLTRSRYKSVAPSHSLCGPIATPSYHKSRKLDLGNARGDPC
jgi:hypothetical protein